MTANLQGQVPSHEPANERPEKSSDYYRPDEAVRSEQARRWLAVARGEVPEPNEDRR